MFYPCFNSTKFLTYFSCFCIFTIDFTRDVIHNRNFYRANSTLFLYRYMLTSKTKLPQLFRLDWARKIGLPCSPSNCLINRYRLNYTFPLLNMFFLKNINTRVFYSRLHRNRKSSTYLEDAFTFWATAVSLLSSRMSIHVTWKSGKKTLIKVVNEISINEPGMSTWCCLPNYFANVSVTNCGKNKSMKHNSQVGNKNI